MPRPCKRRRICAMPGCAQFGPKDGADTRGQTIILNLDEFETIRLIDLEGMTQEQCAAQMGIARTTAQAIYGSARIKLAACLVGGKDLHIAGGDYALCDGNAERCGCGRPCKRNCHGNDANFEEKNKENDHENCSNL